MSEMRGGKRCNGFDCVTCHTLLKTDAVSGGRHLCLFVWLGMGDVGLNT